MMQSAKDTFLLAMRDRLAVVNPARTVVVRGAVRPAVLAGENELVGDAPVDCFALHWTEDVRDLTEPLPLHAMRCEIHYSTRGTGELAGMDRGRVLSAMDAELLQMLRPRWSVKTNYGVTPAVALGTCVFWSHAALGAAIAAQDALQRVAVVTVFAMEEAEG